MPLRMRKQYKAQRSEPAFAPPPKRGGSKKPGLALFPHSPASMALFGSLQSSGAAPGSADAGVAGTAVDDVVAPSGPAGSATAFAQTIRTTRNREPADLI